MRISYWSSDVCSSDLEVQRDDALIEKINLAIDTMAHAIETSTPPLMDAEIAVCDPVEPASDSGAVPADLTELVRRFRLAREAKAVPANSAAFAEHAAEAASQALKSHLTTCAAHAPHGTRPFHNPQK